MYVENTNLVSEVVEDGISVLEFCKKRGCSLVYASTSSFTMETSSI